MPDDRRVALVTGGAHRVGKAIVQALASHGFRVAVHYHGSADAARQTVSELETNDHVAHAFRADLRNADAASTLIDDVVHHFGRLDVLVNSAAVMLRTPVGTVTPQQWDDMFAVNTRAPFFLSQAAAPHLKAARGVIINIADLAAFETWPAYAPHAMTKAAIVQMTRSLAHALAPDIRVNAVAPGAVLLPDDWTAEAAEKLVRTTPLQRLGTPEDVAGAVVYLANASYVTGHTILVDGGRHVRT